MCHRISGSHPLSFVLTWATRLPCEWFTRDLATLGSFSLWLARSSTWCVPSVRGDCRDPFFAGFRKEHHPPSRRITRPIIIIQCNISPRSCACFSAAACRSGRPAVLAVPVRPAPSAALVCLAVLPLQLLLLSLWVTFLRITPFLAFRIIKNFASTHARSLCRRENCRLKRLG